MGWTNLNYVICVHVRVYGEMLHNDPEVERMMNGARFLEV